MSKPLTIYIKSSIEASDLSNNNVVGLDTPLKNHMWRLTYNSGQNI